MSEKKNLATRVSALLRKNSFLKILSVLLAVIFWIYILYVLNPVNDKEFNRISVDLAYEGSIPERNGLMHLLSDTNLSIYVKVSGSRSELMNVSEADIRATLNLNPITREGTHGVAVSVSTGNKDLKIVDYDPKNFTIESASVSSRTIPVDLQASGSLPDGYFIEQSGISPTEITVTGPATTVASIDKAYVSVPLTNVKENISGEFDISLVNKNGENVDRRFLTIANDVKKAEANLTVQYRKDMEATVNVINSSGGNESDYITVTLDTQTIQGTGNEKELAGIEKFSVGTIDTSTIKESGTVTLTLPQKEGVVLNKEQVIATVEVAPETGTKEILFKATDITINNMPQGTVGEVTASARIRIRAKTSDLELLTSETLKCQVDYTDRTDDGSYPIIVYATTGSTTSFGVVGSYFLTESQVTVHEIGLH